MSGWEKVLLPRGAALMDVLEGKPGAVLPPYDLALAWGSRGARASSHNHEAEAWTFEAVRAVLSTSGEDRIRWNNAREVLVRTFFPRELTALWGDEEMCPDPHGGQELIGPTFALIAAVVAQDTELLAMAKRLFRLNAKALLCVATPLLEVWSAGFRASGPPRSSVATEWLRELFNRPHGKALQGSRRVPAEQKWQDHQYLAVRGLRWLRKQQHDVGAVTASPCSLRHPMTVYRWEKGHLSVIPKPVKPIHGVCDWCQVDYQSGIVEHGLDWSAEPPAPPHGAAEIRFPGGVK
jgi:hypothetical protein